MAQYTEPVRELFELSKYIKPPSLKGHEQDEENCDKTQANIPEKVMHCAIHDGLPDSLKHKLDKKQVYYQIMTDTIF